MGAKKSIGNVKNFLGNFRKKFGVLLMTEEEKQESQELSKCISAVICGKELMIAYHAMNLVYDEIIAQINASKQNALT